MQRRAMGSVGDNEVDIAGRKHDLTRLMLERSDQFSCRANGRHQTEYDQNLP